MIEELAISGGGVRGLAFVAAIYELENKGLFDMTKVKRISGTSIGAFIAVCLLSGYSSRELLDKLFRYNFSDIKDIDIENMISSKSILKGNALNTFFTTILEHKIDINTTLLELYQKTNIDFIAATCCLNTSSVEYLSYRNYPDLDILKCIRMSTAIPGILPAINHKDKIYIDGGLLDNLPLRCLSENAWGIKSTTKEDNVKKFIPSDDLTFVTYFKTILKMVYDSKTKKEHKNGQRIILVDVGKVNVTSFNVTLDQKFQLIQSGIQGVRLYS